MHRQQLDVAADRRGQRSVNGMVRIRLPDQQADQKRSDHHADALRQRQRRLDGSGRSADALRRQPTGSFRSARIARTRRRPFRVRFQVERQPGRPERSDLAVPERGHGSEPPVQLPLHLEQIDGKKLPPQKSGGFSFKYHYICYICR